MLDAVINFGHKFLSRVNAFIDNKPPRVVMQAGTGISGAPIYSITEYGSGAKYAGGMSASKTVVIHDHFSLRQGARDAMYDSTVARGIVTRFADTVVDTGLVLKPTPIYQLLGLTPEQAEQWSDNVAERFHIYSMSKKSHRSRVNNFYQNQRLYELFQQRDNDIFVRFYYSKDKDVSNPLQIEFLDPNQIRGYSYTSTYTQFPGDDGILRDPSRREIGYKIWNFNNSTGAYEQSEIPAVGEKSGRIFMIHGYNPEFAGQGRGYSRLTHALQEFEKLTDFSLSTIQKAITQSSITMIMENDQKDPSNPLEGRAAGPSKEYGSQPQPADAALNVTPESTQPIANYTAMPEATLNAPGSVGVFNARKGDHLKPFQDTSPSQTYNQFVDAFCSYLCASTGMPIELLLMKFNANYSASRATLIMFWRIVQMWRDEMATDFLNPIYKMWLSEEIASGRIQCPGWSDPLLQDAWLSCQWSSSPMPNIDPLKSLNADQLATELGYQTLDDGARNWNGSQGKANRSKNKRQYEELPTPPWSNKDFMTTPESSSGGEPIQKKGNNKNADNGGGGK